MFICVTGLLIAINVCKSVGAKMGEITNLAYASSLNLFSSVLGVFMGLKNKCLKPPTSVFDAAPWFW